MWHITIESIYVLNATTLIEEVDEEHCAAKVYTWMNQNIIVYILRPALSISISMEFILEMANHDLYLRYLFWKIELCFRYWFMNYYVFLWVKRYDSNLNWTFNDFTYIHYSLISKGLIPFIHNFWESNIAKFNEVYFLLNKKSVMFFWKENLAHSIHELISMCKL